MQHGHLQPPCILLQGMELGDGIFLGAEGLRIRGGICREAW